MGEPATLFDPAPFTVSHSDAGRHKLSADRRRTLRHAAQLARGTHPIAHLPLHADAAPHDDRTAEGLRCRDCAFHAVLGHHNRSYPKCTEPVLLRDGEPLHPADAKRMHNASHSAATDCRGWYPACVAFKPREAAHG